MFAAINLRGIVAMPSLVFCQRAGYDAGVQSWQAKWQKRLMSELRNVDQAVQDILAQTERLTAETVPLPQTLGRILAEDITSDADLPPFDNAAMDGFAIVATDSAAASRDDPITLPVVLDIRAGNSPQQTLQGGQAARVMTGAPTPPGATAVIPVEDTDADFSQDGAPQQVTLFKAVPEGANIRRAGENIRRGQQVLQAGTKIRPAEIGILATLGQGQVAVIRKPRVVIVGSGDELVGLDEALTPGKIRDSNSYALAALVEQYGGEATRLPPAKDTPAAIRATFEEALAQQPDAIISSAGVSVGAADYVRGILEEMGALDFWRINMRPGKPLAYGHIGGVPFFGLPGNPVSAMVTFEVIVRPALLKMGGQPDDSRFVEAIAAHDMRSDGRRTFARVTLTKDGDRWLAQETGTQSSGAHVSLLLADGLLIIPEGRRMVEAGSRLAVKLLRTVNE